MDDYCADCGGFDIERMYTCQKHGTQFCRGCECPFCAEDELDEIDLYEDYEDDDK